MPSLARIENKTGQLGGAGLARRYRADAHGLTAFRTLASIDYDRSLSTLIESEIIPRLMIAHAVDIAEVAAVEIDACEISALAPLALEVEADALLAHIEAILARGVSVDTVMVDLLAPAARLLGEYWEEDRCDFVDVTMGLWRLQEVVHEIAARMPADRMLAIGGHRALFASMPGDQHNFGTVVIDELFRRDGWVTDRMSGVETTDLVRRVGADWFDMVGLTVSCDRHIANLTSVIAALRNVSKNPRVCIMVGGRIFSADPELATQVGADGTASDARQALIVAADLVRVREQEPLDG
ncbi:cobalamin B12-binding domain-containing protein [Sphingomonas radiodurans]|uniref:cobalamin B12-binding domain-containing protein n=1 Tax=Sphingomonas radiodurans TaxID=2890321 RepID=UPI001E377E9F|nr:cobalamin B12-binding domain-containing protein [Sphingomonas radiodurans]WBH15594.1 cobalamin B12-binding domain-containing protein [Sphingomonas radiodurans]